MRKTPAYSYTYGGVRDPFRKRETIGSSKSSVKALYKEASFIAGAYEI